MRKYYFIYRKSARGLVEVSKAEALKARVFFETASEITLRERTAPLGLSRSYGRGMHVLDLERLSPQHFIGPGNMGFCGVAVSRQVGFDGHGRSEYIKVLLFNSAFTCAYFRVNQKGEIDIATMPRFSPSLVVTNIWQLPRGSCNEFSFETETIFAAPSLEVLLEYLTKVDGPCTRYSKDLHIPIGVQQQFQVGDPWQFDATPVGHLPTRRGSALVFELSSTVHLFSERRSKNGYHLEIV